MQYIFNQIKAAFWKLRNQSLSMRRRLIVYLVVLSFLLVFIIFLALNILGLLNPMEDKVAHALDYQLSVSSAQFDNDVDELTTCAVSLSMQLTSILSQRLREKEVKFNELNGEISDLIELQESAYDTVYTMMQLAPCSGAFYFLDISANKSIESQAYSGVYLKYVNISTANTLNNRVCLYRGLPEVARKNGINLHSSWELEVKENDFSDICNLLNTDVHDLTKSYYLTNVCNLPGTWENAQFLCIPIMDTKGKVIGVCGFEVSALLFSLSHKTAIVSYDYICCGILSKKNEKYSGLFAGSQSGGIPLNSEDIVLTLGAPFDTITIGDKGYFGIHQSRNVAGTEYLVMSFLPISEYSQIRQQYLAKLTTLLLVLLLIMVGSCIFFSHKYLVPILNGLKTLKKETTSEDLKKQIPEIEDLFKFLEKKDMEIAATVANLDKKKTALEAELVRVYGDLDLLAKEQKNKMDTDVYIHFITGIETLTPREKEVFGLYYNGYTANQIVEKLGFTKNGLKYHNGNIYSKLGVSSRKQLLQYIALMRSEKESVNSSSKDE